MLSRLVRRVKGTGFSDKSKHFIISRSCQLSSSSAKDMVKFLKAALDSEDARKEAIKNVLLKQLYSSSFKDSIQQCKSDPNVQLCDNYNGSMTTAEDCNDKMQDQFTQNEHCKLHRDTCERFITTLSSKRGSSNEMLKVFIMSYAKLLTRQLGEPSHAKEELQKLKKIMISLELKCADPFHLLISHCASHGQIDLCFNLIRTMKELEIELSATTYEPLIIFYTKSLEISKAEHILRAMEESGMLATTKAYEHIVYAYAASDNFERAYNIIEYISNKGIVRTTAMYSPIIYAYAIKGHYARAWDAFKAMKNAMVKPDAKNFSDFIMACARRNDCKQAKQVLNAFREQKDYSLEDTEKVLSAMVQGYCNCGKEEEAIKLLSDSGFLGLLDTTNVKSAFLNSLAKRGEIEGAKKIFQDILESGSWPSSHSFHSLLFAIRRLKDLDEMFPLFESFVKSIRRRNRIAQEEEISKACTVIFLQLLIDQSELEKTIQFLQRVQRDKIGDVDTMCLQVFTVCDKRLPLTLGYKFKFLEAMHEKLNMQPSRITYEALLESCAKARDVEHSMFIVQMMKRDQLPLNMFTYLILLRTVVSTGDAVQAKCIVKEIQREMKSKGLNDANVRTIISQILLKSSCENDDDSEWKEELFQILYG